MNACTVRIHLHVNASRPNQLQRDGGDPRPFAGVKGGDSLTLNESLSEFQNVRLLRRFPDYANGADVAARTTSVSELCENDTTVLCHLLCFVEASRDKNRQS